MGIGTLGIPFAAVALVGVAGVSVVAGTIHEISEMSLDERIVIGNHGFIGVNAYKN